MCSKNSAGRDFGGLSGVVYALMGYVWLRGERDPQSGIYLQRGLIIFAPIWIVAGWFYLFGDVDGERSTHRRVSLAFSDGFCRFAQCAKTKIIPGIL
ncbi:hypothetical protein ACLB1T_09350 [Escherichia coli]